MCATCGCSDENAVRVRNSLTGDLATLSHAEAHARGIPHHHGEGADPHHAHQPFDPPIHLRQSLDAWPASGTDAAALAARVHGATLALEQDILGKNQTLADRNRDWLTAQGILALNLVSSPGAGKTTLLEQTLRTLRGEFDIGVIEGDQETIHDAERIRATGCPAIQINTGTGCHLDADMLARGLAGLNPAPRSLLFIENVGNLVCPALFDLGEHAKVAILSVTEGEDKPLKYPHMFRASRLLLLNKIDLLPHLRFDVDRCLAYAREVNPEIEILRLSAATGAGMSAWHQWLRHEFHRLVRGAAPGPATSGS
jgi:hydrogenase nickel incorporation protein HypB